MQFLIFTEDHVEKYQLRLDNRNAHLKWLKAQNSDVRLLSAGPWMDDEGMMKGSLLIVDAATKGEVQSWLENDPYMKAGLTRQAIVKAYNWAIGAPNNS